MSTAISAPPPNDQDINLTFTPPSYWVPEADLVPPRRAHGRPGPEPARLPARPDLAWFRENLVRGMIARNMTASDVARALWGEKTNAQGNTVAKGRDRMTGYLSGSVYPNETNITKLCEVLDLTREQLAVDTSRSHLSRPAPVPPPVRDHDIPIRRTPPKSLPETGTLVFEIVGPNRVRVAYEQILSEEIAFQLLNEIRRLARANQPDGDDKGEANAGPTTPPG